MLHTLIRTARSFLNSLDLEDCLSVRLRLLFKAADIIVPLKKTLIVLALATPKPRV